MIEPATPEDRGAILDSWLKSYRNADSAGLIPTDEWALVMAPVLEDILDRSEALVMRGTTPGTTYGWLVHEGRELVHYIYVWHAYREKGVATALLNAAGLASKFFYSCRTPVGEEFVRRRVPRPKFNPKYARFGSTPEQRRKITHGKAVPVTHSR